VVGREGVGICRYVLIQVRTGGLIFGGERGREQNGGKEVEGIGGTGEEEKGKIARG
jgi:hypothetical protein